MKRQRGRNRGGGGGNGGGKPQQNANRAFDSNGPDNVKIRGHAQHVFEKYQQYARDAFSSGDRVLAENYLQHADHYFRVLRTIQPQRSPSEILGRDVLASGLDIDFEEEFEPGEEGSDVSAEVEANGEGRYEPRRDSEGQSREGQSREGQPREGQFRDRNDGRRDGYEPRERNGDVRQDRYGEGQSRPRNDNGGRERSDSQSRDRQEGRDRGERQDAYGVRRDPRSFEPRREERSYGRGEREGRFEERRPEERRPGERSSSEAPMVGDPLPMIAPAVPTSAFPVSSAHEADSSPVLRSEDGGMSEAPAFLQPAAGEDAELRKPRARRRRAPRSFEPPGGGDEAQTSSEVQPEDA